MARKRSGKLAGIEVIHRKGCPAKLRSDAECRCKPGYRALVFDKRVGRRAKTKVFGTLREARDERTRLLAALRDGSLAKPTSITFQDAAKALIEGMSSGAVRTRRGRIYKPGTVLCYEGVLRVYALPEIGAERLSDIDRFRIQRLISSLLARGLSGSTVNNAIVPVRLVFGHAVDHGVLTVDPTAKLRMPALNEPDLQIVSADETEARLELLGGWVRAAWATAFYAGLRRGELLGLRIEDVDFEHQLISVEQSFDVKSGQFVKPKSKAGERSIPLTECLAAVLRPCIDGLPWHSGLIFGEDHETPVRAGRITELAWQRWRAAGFDRLILHAARHTFVSFMIAAGLNPKAIQTFAGHASIAFTFNRYGHLFPGQEQEAAQLLDNYLGQ